MYLSNFVKRKKETGTGTCPLPIKAHTHLRKGRGVKFTLQFQQRLLGMLH